MIKPLPPHTPIASVFKQIEDGIKFSVRAGAPITDSQQLMAAETLIMKMGCKYNHACRKWKGETRSIRDYNAFKIYITKDAKLQTQMASTAADAGHHGANVTEVDNVDSEMASAANQFAMSQAAQDKALATLADTNRDPHLQLANMTLQTQEFQTQVQQMQQPQAGQPQAAHMQQYQQAHTPQQQPAHQAPPPPVTAPFTPMYPATPPAACQTSATPVPPLFQQQRGQQQQQPPWKQQQQQPRNPPWQQQRGGNNPNGGGAQGAPPWQQNRQAQQGGQRQNGQQGSHAPRQS